MSLARWQATIVNGAGDIQAGASVEVRSELTGSLVPLFSDRAGTVGILNPFVADAEGFAFFYVVGGSYKITATSGAYTREWRHVGIGTANEFDDNKLTADTTIYVRADATGDTNRDGSADTVGSAFQTWQAAINWFDANCFCNGFTPIFKQGTAGVTFPHNYTAAGPVISITKRPTGGHKRQITFGLVNDDDVRLECTSGSSNATLSVSDDFGAITFTGKVRLRSTGFHFKNNGHGKVIQTGVWRHQNNGGTHYIQNQQEGSYFAQNGELLWEADCEAPLRNDSGTYHGNGNITLVGARTFSNGAYRGDFFSQGYLQGVQFLGTYTGPRFLLKDRAVIRYLSSQPPPGSTRGLARPGCVVSWDGLTENVVVGSAAFVASSTIDVVFDGSSAPATQFDTNYLVTISGGNIARTYHVAPGDRLLDGFRITASASNSDTVWWRLEWLPS